MVGRPLTSWTVDSTIFSRADSLAVTYCLYCLPGIQGTNIPPLSKKGNFPVISNVWKKKIFLAALAVNCTNNKLFWRLIMLPSVPMTINQRHQQLTTLPVISKQEQQQQKNQQTQLNLLVICSGSVRSPLKRKSRAGPRWNRKSASPFLLKHQQILILSFKFYDRRWLIIWSNFKRCKFCYIKS